MACNRGGGQGDAEGGTEGRSGSPFELDPRFVLQTLLMGAHLWDKLDSTWHTRHLTFPSLPPLSNSLHPLHSNPSSSSSLFAPSPHPSVCPLFCILHPTVHLSIHLSITTYRHVCIVAPVWAALLASLPHHPRFGRLLLCMTALQRHLKNGPR